MAAGGGRRRREVEEQFGIVRPFAGGLADHRDPEAIEFSVLERLRQRVTGLALGYEDLNDHDRLRHDPVHGDQLGKFFHGDDKPSGFLPQYAFCKGWPPCSGRRTSTRVRGPWIS